ncbi:MAG: hypothetical protein ACI8RZ_000233 [Myxococcota bacterium]|jgi:hypothetical protein
MLSFLLLCSCGRGDLTAPPLLEDDRYTTTSRAWTLIGNALTEGHDTLEITVTFPEGEEEVLVWLDNALQPSLSLDLSEVGPGSHTVLLSVDGGESAFAAVDFLRTHPLYVITSVDWDQADTADGELDWHLALHEDHPSLRLTQFVGPYTFTDPEVSPERAEELVSWLRSTEETYGDEIGLHIHPYCSFVETTDVTCRHEPSYVFTDGDDTGYTVLSSAYTQEEYVTLLLASVALFEDNGLPRPTTFRAGGWIADSTVLSALDEAGFVADTSALNWPLIEEWEDQASSGSEYNSVLFDWNAENWSDIGATSQPYHPDPVDPQVPGAPGLSLLEVPDNAALADYVSVEDMLAVLEANWDGGVLDAPIAFSIGYHNSTYPGYRYGIEETLNHLDGFLAEDDTGPIIYATLDEMPLVWP